MNQLRIPDKHAEAHPGWTATDLQRHDRTIRAFNPLMGMAPWQGALSTLYAAIAREAKSGEYCGPHGFFEMMGYPVRVNTTEAARDRDSARRLREVSEEMTGVQFEL